MVDKCVSLFMHCRFIYWCGTQWSFSESNVQSNDTRPGLPEVESRRVKEYDDQRMKSTFGTLSKSKSKYKLIFHALCFIYLSYFRHT